MASGGSAAADAMINKLFAAGLITEEQRDAGIGNGDGTTIDPLDPSSSTGLANANKAEAKSQWKESYIKGKLTAKTAELMSDPRNIYALRSGEITTADIDSLAMNMLSSEFERLYAERQYNSSGNADKNLEMTAYAKGGLVDYTGLAQVHGSSSSPEMVLDAAQTQMFMNLRDILGKISVSGGNSESINIEKIEIKTDKLNGNQDFDAAGKVLANAFSKAIKNRGITANVKR